jgi:hypothetical protein
LNAWLSNVSMLALVVAAAAVPRWAAEFLEHLPRDGVAGAQDRNRLLMAAGGKDGIDVASGCSDNATFCAPWDR